MIDVKGLHFSYPGTDREAVSDMVFTVAPGEILGFLGPSGAGKSTTQRILTRQLRGWRGRISVLGRDLSDWGSDYYERIGIAFELPTHFLKLTARENLNYFGALYRRRALEPLEALSLVGLSDAADTPVAHFSKGMKTRLGVARALLHDPDLLFLDEPTTGLDPTNAKRVLDLVRDRQRAGRTIFLTTHDMASADSMCDRVAFVADGRIQALDTPRSLKLRYGKAVVAVEYQARTLAYPSEDLLTGSEKSIHPPAHLPSQPSLAEFPLEGLGGNHEFLRLLHDHDILTIHSREASLADVFIQVAGRSLT